MWHELGHTYLVAVFTRHQPAITRFAYLAQQDPQANHGATVRGGWSSFFNENVTQAVTNVLKLRTGLITRAEAFADDEFYLYSGELAKLIEQQYPNQLSIRILRLISQPYCAPLPARIRRQPLSSRRKMTDVEGVVT